MIAVIAKANVKDGQEGDFLQVAREIVKKVSEEEGCLFVSVFTAKEPRTYVFLEHYKDRQAIETHLASDHFRTLGRAMGAFLEGPPEVTRLYEVGN